MNIGIYDPYLDTLGGHERYCLDIASCFSGVHKVSIFWHDKEILEKAKDRFHIKTDGIEIVPNIWKQNNLLSRIAKLAQYDAIFFVSDGSIPFVSSKKFFLLFEFPVPWVNGQNIISRIKLHGVTSIICNSTYVKRHIDETFHVNSQVITPGVNTDEFVSGKKLKRILSVGRFTQGMNTKKQAFLIDTFITMYKTGLRDWELRLAGGMLEQDAKFVTQLKAKAKKFPIQIMPNISYSQLRDEYAHASIYWHAAGYGEDEIAHPERVEHFGMSTVEAMSAGAVPIVYNAGGQTDIVGNWIDGFFWKNQDELIGHTKNVIQDKKMHARMSHSAKEKAQQFSRKSFIRNIQTLLH